jgi:hypothetical protein
MKPIHLLPLLSAVLLSASADAAAGYSFRLYASGIRATDVAQAPTSRTYATLNPADKAPSNITLSNGNLTDVSALGSGVRGTIGKSSGKWYYEVSITALAGGYPPVIGIAGADNPLVQGWAGTSDYTYWGSGGGVLIWGNNSRVAYGTNTGVGDIVGVAVDLDNRQVTFYRNGVSQGVAYTSAKLPAGTYYPFVSDPYGYNLSTTMTVNFGQNALTYTPPAGYNAGWYQ